MISIQHKLTGIVCRLSGEFDASNVDGVRLAFDIARSEPLLVIDMCDVTFIDSAGLGALIGAVRKAGQSENQIAIACNAPPLLRLFETVGLDRIVPIAANVQSALDTMRSDPPARDSTPAQSDQHSDYMKALPLPA